MRTKLISNEVRTISDTFVGTGTSVGDLQGMGLTNRGCCGHLGRTRRRRRTRSTRSNSCPPPSYSPEERDGGVRIDHASPSTGLSAGRKQPVTLGCLTRVDISMSSRVVYNTLNLCTGVGSYQYVPCVLKRAVRGLSHGSVRVGRMLTSAGCSDKRTLGCLRSGNVVKCVPYADGCGPGERKFLCSTRGSCCLYGVGGGVAFECVRGTNGDRGRTQVCEDSIRSYGKYPLQDRYVGDGGRGTGRLSAAISQPCCSHSCREMRDDVKQVGGGVHSDAMRPMLKALLSCETVEEIQAEKVGLTGGRIILTTVTCGLGGLVGRGCCGSIKRITVTARGRLRGRDVYLTERGLYVSFRCVISMIRGGRGLSVCAR